MTKTVTPGTEVDALFALVGVKPTAGDRRYYQRAMRNGWSPDWLTVKAREAAGNAGDPPAYFRSILTKASDRGPDPETDPSAVGQPKRPGVPDMTGTGRERGVMDGWQAGIAKARDRLDRATRTTEEPA